MFITKVYLNEPEIVKAVFMVDAAATQVKACEKRLGDVEYVPLRGETEALIRAGKGVVEEREIR